MQPSASRTSLLLACPRPFEAVELEDDAPEEAALYGSAFHEVMASCLRSPSKNPLEKNARRFAREVDRAIKRYDLPHVRQELAGHLKGSIKVLRNWLKREKLEIVAVEKAYAIHPRANGSWGVREIEPHDENHHYEAATYEVPGTVDLIAANKNRSRIVVLDHKTGMYEGWYMTDERFALPTTVAQLRTLGLVAGHIRGKRLPPTEIYPCGTLADVEVAIFHADRKGLPIIYSEPYEPEQQTAHAKALHRALSLIGGGYMRDGSYCHRCPARIGCPARAAALLVESAEVLTEAANKIAREPVDPKALYVLPTEEVIVPGLLESRAGRLYDMLKRFRELDKAATTELRRLVKGGLAIETREGKVLTIQEQTYETLSKKSVIEALGKIAGERELARLRKKGAVREVKREMLVSER